jgi:putative Mg2+ transporter-C (MgtC) family protein
MDWPEISKHCAQVAVAFALALPLGWEREKDDRSAGVRTFPLVAVASCGYVLVAESVFGAAGPDHSRVLQGLITGIGFIGGGAILKGAGSVHGTATAASIWNTGAVGAAVAYGAYEIAVILSVINLLILRFLTPIRKQIRGDDSTT